MVSLFRIGRFLFFFCIISDQAALAQNFGSAGKLFWLGFMDNYSPPTMTVYISSKVNTSGTVSIPLQGWSQNFTVAANSTVGVTLPAAAEMTATEVISNGGVRVVANDTVSVFALCYAPYTSDATLVLPDPALGREYYVTAYKDYFGAPYSDASELMIVGTVPNTLIEITPSVGTNGGRPAGVPFQITLNAGETYLITAGGDLSGTKIESLDNGSGCFNIAVFAGNICTGVECPYCDHLYEEQFPTEAWGKEFITIPYRTRSSDRFRILASQNGTQVTVNGGPVINLNAGQFNDFSTGTASYIAANNPISVAQYSKGNDCDNANADPFFIMLSPVNQTLVNITFNAFTSAVIANYYVNIFSECDDVNSVILDGTNIGGSFTPVPSNPLYCYARPNITQGNHTLTSDSGIIAYIYGYGSYESYGYAAGANTDRKLANFNIYIDGILYVSDTIPICPGDTIAFKGFSDDTTIISWEWLLGDSSYANGDSVIHVYDSLKTYMVQLIVQRMFDCSKDTITKFFSVSGPFVNATPDTSTCSGDPLTLSATAYANSYVWSTGDTSISIIVIPDSSTYYTVEGIMPCPGKMDTVWVLVREVEADFSITQVCPGDTTLFFYQSTVVNDTILSWTWDFDDGSPPSSVQNPSHFYNVSPGTYYAMLAISSSDGGCMDTIYKQVFFQPKPDAGFAFSPVCFSDTAQFLDTTFLASGSIASWTWDFGDTSAVSNLQNPSHYYNYTGTYPVTLNVVTDSGCTDTIVSDIQVFPLPVAAFTFSNTCVYNSAQYYDNSAVSPGVITQWNWSFGDGNTSINQNPSNLYSAPGPYPVALGVVTDNNCMDLYFDTIIIHPRPAAAFSAPGVCEYDTISFYDGSSVSAGNVITWNWDFDDGNTSTAQNPVNFYGAYGIYNVTQVVQSDSGCFDTLVKLVQIFATPSPSFSASNVCDYDTTWFYDNSTVPDGNIASWSWDFGDLSTGTGQYVSHYYSPYGTYTVELTVVSDSGCTDSVTAPVTVYPAPAADFTASNVCLNNPVFFINNSTVPSGSIPVSIWDFGDATPPLAGWNQIHNYAAFGTWFVKLYIASDNNCVDSIIRPVAVHPLPAADFDFENVCAYDSALFTNTSAIPAGNIITYDWDFGDLTSSFAVNPYHYYPGFGSYTVKLVVESDSGCADSIVKTIAIHPVPTADFQVSDVCIYYPAQFSDLSVVIPGAISSWQWDFGDNTPYSDLQNPSHNYSPADTYLVVLIVGSDSGCTDTVSKPVIIFPKPVADFTVDSVCLNIPSTFTDLSSVSSGQINQWAWDFGDTYTDNVQNPVHIYNPDNQYTITLIVITDNSCSDTISKTTLVYPLPQAGFQVGSICEQEIISFDDTSNGNIIMWQWDFGDGTGTSILTDPQYIYPSEGTFNVSLTVTNNFNCVDMIIQPVPVYAKPDISFVADVYAGCTPLEVNFTNTSIVSNGYVTGQIWNFGDNSYSNSANPTHIYTMPGQYTITLDVTSDMNCRDIGIFPDTITVYALPVADFSFYPDSPTILTSQITFTDFSSPVVLWEWNFGDGGTSGDQNPVHMYEDTGIYAVVLWVTNERGCKDDVVRPVHIYPEFIFFIPNAFTPTRKDGINDVFLGQGFGIKEFHMYIYDRWGDMIFETTDYLTGWDGRANKGKKMAQQDVYVYYILIKDVNNKEHEFVGHVTLVK